MNDKSVRVAVRVRPLVPSETAKGSKDILDIYPDVNQIRISNSEKAFSYNHVYGPISTQAEIYKGCVQPMIQSLFNGYNLTVLAYGQTGSGKTHTMGTTYDGNGEMGVIPRAVTDIFTYIKDNFTHDFTVTVSFMELYQETLYDLLSEKSRDQCVLDIREDPSKGILIPGLTQIPVKNIKEVFQQLTKGAAFRVTGATNMNSCSSRSHAIFTISVVMQDKKDGSEKSAKFHMVDLAGSERPKKTGAVGTTFKEGVNINKGLLVLGNVISALGDPQNNFVPYRDSNLTRLLKDSLGGNSITLMLACVSPADYNLEETVSTLRYADRAKKIQNKPIVNQDPKAAEINLLKKTIQELKLQIVGQGGPVLCDEIAQIKEENLRQQTKIRDLTVQLSTVLTDNTGLLEKLMILQSANETLNRKIQELKKDYDVTLEQMNISLVENDSDRIKTNLAKLKELQEQFSIIDSEQRRTESEILHHEQNIDLQNSEEARLSLDMSKDQEHFTNKQMALNTELQEITKKLAIKEHLAKQIETNSLHMVDYKAMAENEDKILQLQREKDELLQQLKNAQGSKISEQRRKRVQELEQQIHDLNRKVQEQSRLIKMKEKDVSKIKVLNNEILQMKQTRVKLIRKMREESERFRTWKIQRERELAKLKQQDRKKQNQIVKMEVMHSKQQNVLKRKVEEAVALNKRLKESLALRKVAQDMKGGKVEKVGAWMKQELEVQLHLVEAEVTLAGLLEDRSVLQEQLEEARSRGDVEEAKSLEEEIEMRSVQIQDLQQKILDSDEDNKKPKLDNIQTMAEAKFALKTVLEQVTELKKSEVTAKNKLTDLQSCLNETHYKNQNFEKAFKVLEYKHAEDVANLEKEYEEKVAVLLRQLRGVEVQNANDDLKHRCEIQTKKIEDLDEQNQKLMEKLMEAEKRSDELNKTITKITEFAQKGEPIPFQTPEQPIRRKKMKIKKEIDSTFTKEDIIDVSLEEVDDIENDPDWRKTPVGKWILEKKRKTLLRNSESENGDVSRKRTSEGGCTCKTGCSSRCGCRKGNKACNSSCKCPQSCSNKDIKDQNSGEKKRKLFRTSELNTLE